MTESKLFVRRASGLARAWSPLDLFMRGAGSSNPFGPWMLFALLIAPFIVPGVNIPLAMLVALVFWCISAATYGMFCATMPRSGGDYVWMSRSFKPSIAFGLIVLEMTMYGAWTYFNTLAAATLGVLPLATYFGNTGLVAWISSSTGLLTWAAFWIILTALVVIAGMKYVAYWQRIFWPALIVILGLYLVVAFSFGHDAFVAAFNSQFNSVLSTGNAYQYVINAAPTPKVYNFSVSDTLYAAPILTAAIGFMQGAAPVVGEVKGVGNLRMAMFVFLAIPIACTIEAALAALAFMNLVGPTFMTAVGYQFATGGALASKIPFTALLTYVVMIMVKNPWLALIIGLGPIVANMNYYPYPYLMISRWLFAMSFDRLLPAKMVEVERRTRSPIYAVLFVLVLNLAWAGLVAFAGSSVVWYFGAATIGGIFLAIFVGIAAAIFPFRKGTKAIYQASPVAKYKIAGIPLMAILGVLSAISITVFAGYMWIWPYYGTSSPISLTAFFVIWLIGIVYYYVVRWYRGRQGIPLDLAFIEVPPE
jgi:amino acid transporter